MTFWISNVCKAQFSTTLQRRVSNFGILFDIDGVIVKGSRTLPSAIKAFQCLTDDNGKFRVPIAFVTNAGNCLRQTKADRLSEALGVHIDQDQVVMSHTPLKMFKDYHDQHVLVVGQGPVKEIATNLGFRNVSTIDEIRHAFPTLDAVDHKRRISAPCGFGDYFPRIDSVVLFGEPIRWETSLQLLIDILLTNGLPSSCPDDGNPYPHIPVLACNMDLLWSTEAPMPRFGHGAFLLSLESLYKKVTNQDLVYTALVGKPSEITLKYGEHVVQNQAKHIYGPTFRSPLRHIYFVGDNVNTDVFGANLYDKYLLQKQESQSPQLQISMSRSMGTRQGELLEGAERCFSVLVETGVYSKTSNDHLTLNHAPRDFLPVEKSCQKPFMIVPDVLRAVEAIFDTEINNS